MNATPTDCLSLAPVLAGDALPATRETHRWFRIDVTISESVREAIVRIAGDASVHHAGALEAGLFGLGARRMSLVIFDLSRVTHLSALATGVLTTFVRGVIRRGSLVRLNPAPPAPVREILDGAGLTRLFEAAASGTP
jgi:anti-anti-sigma regulatory factor